MYNPEGYHEFLIQEGRKTSTATMAVNLPNFPEYDLNPKDTVTSRWDKLVKKLNNLFLAKDPDPERKNAILLHYAREQNQ